MPEGTSVKGGAFRWRVIVHANEVLLDFEPASVQLYAFNYEELQAFMERLEDAAVQVKPTGCTCGVGGAPGRTHQPDCALSRKFAP